MAEKKKVAKPVTAQFDWAGEVDRAIAKGWLNEEKREAALALISTDRDKYDALLSIPKDAEEQK